MNKIIMLACALVAPGWVCFGQTNAAAVAAKMPPVPALKLPTLTGQASPAISLPAGAHSPAGPMSLEETGAQTHLNALADRMRLEGKKSAALNRMDQEGLVKPAEPAYGSDFDRNMAAAFKPEIIQSGRAQIYSSVVTAVARKNPLCALDPTFLTISF